MKYFVQCFINNCREPFRSQLSARNPQRLTEILNLITNDLQYIHNQQKIHNMQQPTPKNQINFHQNSFKQPQQTQKTFKSQQSQKPFGSQQSHNHFKTFAPEANVRNVANLRTPQPMSLQSAQYTPRHFNQQKSQNRHELFTQNLETNEQTQDTEYLETTSNIDTENV